MKSNHILFSNLFKLDCLVFFRFLLIIKNNVSNIIDLNYLLKIIWYILLYRQSKKKKNSTPESKVSEEIDHSKNTMEIKQEGTIDESTPDELETKVDETVEKELDDTEVDTNVEKNDKEVIADESLVDVESLPESQPEQPTKSSKSSKRSTDRKSKSRSSRASKYVTNNMYILKS